jgi:hypothetical protein
MSLGQETRINFKYMKTFSFPAILSAIALMAAQHATATPLPTPFHGPVTIAWPITQQNLDNAAKYPGNGKTNITGTTSKTTNVMQIYTSTVTTAPFNNASLLALLANSLNTTFPAATELVTDGSTLYVTDHTGTNEIVAISNIVTVTGNFKADAGANTRNQITTKSGTTSTDVGTASGSQFITLNYDDSALVTTDGTTTTFEFAGVSAFTRKGSTTVATNGVISVKESGSFKITGSGSGSIRGKTSIITGTVVGTPAGTETIKIQ